MAIATVPIYRADNCFRSQRFKHSNGQVQIFEHTNGEIDSGVQRSQFKIFDDVRRISEHLQFQKFEGRSESQPFQLFRGGHLNGVVNALVNAVTARSRAI